jgi:hypothetical protein
MGSFRPHAEASRTRNQPTALGMHKLLRAPAHSDPSTSYGARARPSLEMSVLQQRNYAWDHPQMDRLKSSRPRLSRGHPQPAPRRFHRAKKKPRRSGAFGSFVNHACGPYVIRCRRWLREEHSRSQKLSRAPSARYWVTISGKIRAVAIARTANATKAIRPKFHSDGQRVCGFRSIGGRIPCMQNSLCERDKHSAANSRRT